MLFGLQVFVGVFDKTTLNFRRSNLGAEKDHTHRRFTLFIGNIRALLRNMDTSNVLFCLVSLNTITINVNFCV
jgi:hypothetical protein